MSSAILENVPLAPYTTLSIGGPARYFIRAESEKTVAEAVRFAAERQIPILVLGGGSNLLVADAGFPGLVAQIAIKGVGWRDAGSRVHVTAGAGEEWDEIVARSVERDLAGLECLSGIPGSVGGTPVQNVGAYGQEVAETLTCLRALDRETGVAVEMSQGECRFGYRSSLFNSSARNRYVILSVTYALEKHGPPALKYAELRQEFDGVDPSLVQVRAAVLRTRARKAMLLQAGDPDSRSAGSFFKNPLLTAAQFSRLESISGKHPPCYPAADGMVKTAAAWLVEHAGFEKGYRVGNVGISSRHALALVNKGGATAAELVALAREIRMRVEDRFSIRLAAEPVLVGFDGDVI